MKLFTFEIPVCIREDNWEDCEDTIAISVMAIGFAEAKSVFKLALAKAMTQAVNRDLDVSFYSDFSGGE